MRSRQQATASRGGTQTEASTLLRSASSPHGVSRPPLIDHQRSVPVAAAAEEGKNGFRPAALVALETDGSSVAVSPANANGASAAAALQIANTRSTKRSEREKVSILLSLLFEMVIYVH